MSEETAYRACLKRSAEFTKAYWPYEMTDFKTQQTIKMIVGDWYPDERGYLTREVRAAD
jgi:hypothetical protein